MNYTVNKMKKICIISEFPPPAGGIAQQANLLCALLKNNNFEVIKVPVNLNLKINQKQIQNIKYIKTLFAVCIFLYKIFYAVPKSDIIHILANSYLNFFLFTFPAAIMGKLYRKKVIIHYHGGAAKDFFKTWGFAAKFALNLADIIIVPSKFLQSVFKEIGYDSIIIGNITNLDRFHFCKRVKFDPHFLITRHLEHIYNIGFAIRAFAEVCKKFPDAQLDILGDGTERDKLIEIANASGYAESIHFHGTVTNEEIVQFYNTASISLNTSLVDNLPISILEAFASGCVVVTSDSGGIPYIVENHKTGILIDINKQTSLVDAVNWIINHPEKVQKIVVTAKKYANNFSVAKFKKSLINAYGSLY